MVFITTTASASRISGLLPASFPGQGTQDCQALGPVLCKARVARVDAPHPVTGSATPPQSEHRPASRRADHTKPESTFLLSPGPRTGGSGIPATPHASTAALGPPTWLRGERKAFHPEQGKQSCKTRGPQADFSGF